MVLPPRISKDPYCILAKRALEHTILYGLTLPTPVGLPEKMTKTRAGVFISLYIDGQLRGASGTLGPTTEHIAAEIMKNAVAAGLKDKRFTPVTLTELSNLLYKVDIIQNLEFIEGPGQLDPKHHGLVVTSGNKWSVLMPAQSGIETGEQQLVAARQKAGIDTDAPVKLERFEVENHM